MNFARLTTRLSSIVVALALSGTASADYTAIPDKTQNRGTWEGWGCSLAWWANAVGQSSYEKTFADLFFTQNTVTLLPGTSLPGLGLNIARYNIGGGGRPADGAAVNTSEQVPAVMPWQKHIEGFWLDWRSTYTAGTSWDWTRDPRQRSMLKAVSNRGAKIEFFSNAPMWWMTPERSSAGGQLQSWNQANYADYLATVVKYARDNWGINVASVEHFNEPTAGWWTYPLDQEGVNIPVATQAVMLGNLRASLDARGLWDVGIAASDENTMVQGLASYNYLKATQVPQDVLTANAAQLTSKLNVHGYDGQLPWRDNAARQALRAAAGKKPIWVSEYGDGDGSGMSLATSITEDINFLQPTAWIYWQPLENFSAWGMVNADYGTLTSPSGGNTVTPTWVYTKYYVFAQFTRFLRPGYQLLANNDTNSVFAYDNVNHRLVIISVNYGAAQNITYDLSSLYAVPNGTASVTVTNSAGPKALASATAKVSNKKLTIPAEVNSIYSIVVPNVWL